MWANLRPLSWLSLIPVLTDHHSTAPAATYGVVCLGSATVHTILVLAIFRSQRLAQGAGVSAVASPGATLLMLSLGPGRWRWLVDGAAQEEVETAFAGWQMLAAESADTAGLGWPMNKTALRGTGCAAAPSTTLSYLAPSAARLDDVVRHCPISHPQRRGSMMSRSAHSCRNERVVGAHTYALNCILTLLLIHGP
jgi:hypothetical protein